MRAAIDTLPVHFIGCDGTVVGSNRARIACRVAHVSMLKGRMRAPDLIFECVPLCRPIYPRLPGVSNFQTNQAHQFERVALRYHAFTQLVIEAHLAVYDGILKVLILNRGTERAGDFR